MADRASTPNKAPAGSIPCRLGAVRGNFERGAVFRTCAVRTCAIAAHFVVDPVRRNVNLGKEDDSKLSTYSHSLSNRVHPCPLRNCFSARRTQRGGCPMSELFKQPFPDRLGSLTGLRARLRWRETDSRRAARGQSSWLRMEQLEDRLAPTVSLAQNFTGIDSAQTSGIPPDATAAVGPNTVIETVNRAITLMDKTGSTRVGPIDLSTFFSSIFTAHDFIMDPSVVYDDQAGRFYVVLEESGFVQGQLDFAVSKGSNPATLGPTDWSFYAITEVNEGGTASPGIPKIGWNDDAVFLSTNQGNTPSLHCHILAVSKLSLLAGGALSFNSTNITTNSERNILVPARMHNE